MKKALPGLTEEQFVTILDRCDGNPRLLTELIQYALSNSSLFATRDVTQALTEKGLEHLRKDPLSYSALIAKRFASLPDDVKSFVSMGSIQGIVFADDLAKSVVNNLWQSDIANDIAIKADSPCAVTKKTSMLSSEFRGRALYIQAHEMMQLGDEDYEKAKQLTLKEIELMSLDGRWEKLDNSDQIRLRSFYVDTAPDTYKSDFPDVRLLLALAHLKDIHEINGSLEDNQEEMFIPDDEYERPQIEDPEIYDLLDIEYDDYRFGVAAIEVRREIISTKGETLPRLLKLALDIHHLSQLSG